MAGVTTNPYQFGGIEFRVNKRDMGHIHGEQACRSTISD